MTSLFGDLPLGSSPWIAASKCSRSSSSCLGQTFSVTSSCSNQFRPQPTNSMFLISIMKNAIEITTPHSATIAAYIEYDAAATEAASCDWIADLGDLVHAVGAEVSPCLAVAAFVKPSFIAAP